MHARVTVTEIRYKTLSKLDARLAAKSLAMGDVGTVNVSFDRRVAFEPYNANALLASFTIYDALTHEPLGTGVLRFALRRSANLFWQTIDVDRTARASIKNQNPRCIWLTGLSGSGKSTIANLLDRKFHAAGLHTYVLDGDNVRHGLNRDLGFTEPDRAENIRRVAEVARLMVDAGLIIIVSFISPYRSERAFARGLFQPGEFVEVFVDTPLEVCAQRDPKGLYAKAKAGELPNFTGIDSPYERPETPEIVLNTIICSPMEAVDQVVNACNLTRTMHSDPHIPSGR